MNNADKPANPVTWVNPESGDTRREYGLTKREYFAGLAMQGLLASDVEANMDKHDIAVQAVDHADALLTRLDRERG